MKTKQLFILTAVLAIALALFAPAQAFAHNSLPTVGKPTASPFASFRTHRQGKGITATWSVSGTESIVAFTVQRTYEDPTDVYAYWEDLSTIAFTPSRSFTYKDTQVFPGTVHYRIVALLSDGTTAVSEISSVRIVSHK